MSKEEYQYHPFFEQTCAGYKVTNAYGVHLYTVRLYPPDAFGAVRIEVRDADNNVIRTDLVSIYLTEN